MKINGEYVYNNDRYSTEDIVKKDKDNRYYILGRSDDLFIGPNGENINPERCAERTLHRIKKNSNKKPNSNLLLHLSGMERTTGFEPATFSLGS